MRTTNATVDGAVYRRRRISESLFITTSMDDYDEEKRIQHNLFIRSGKSEAEVITKDCARRLYY